MATFYNQATLSFRGRLTNSNITSGELRDTLAMTKTALSSSYTSGGNIVYAININNSGSAISGATVTDDLGGYNVGTNTVYPLEYVEGSVRLFVGGIESTAPSVTAGPPLSFTGIDIPANTNVQIYYETSLNSFAPLAEGSSITNTAVLNIGATAAATATATVTSDSDAELTIAKAICPAVVVDDGQLTYTFVIQNTGNTATLATDDVIVTDVFDPILSGISVTFNGEPWEEGTNYTYDETSGTFATIAGQITVPAATYTQNPDTGVITTSPGVAVITVSGTV